MKRVLHVLSSLQRSGMEMMLLCSYSEWISEGCSCDILATAPSIGPLAPDLQKAGYRVHHLPFRGIFRYLPSFRFLHEYWRLCSGYDIVHVHTEAATPLFVILARLAGLKTVVLTLHNTFRFTGVLRFRKYLERLTLRSLGCRYGMISDDVQKCEWDHYRNPGVRTWNWINTDHFLPCSEMERTRARQTLGIAPDEFVLISVGNCNKAKNHQALLHALPKLQLSPVPLYLHVGKEPTETPERQLAVELSIEDHVRFAGSQPDSLPFLQAADIFVMPSLWEGLPLSALEAVAVGLPTVFCDAAGLRGVAAEMVYPVLTACDPTAIAHGIDQVRSIGSGERRRRGLEDSIRIRKRFSVQNGVSSIVRGLYIDTKDSELQGEAN